MIKYTHKWGEETTFSIEEFCIQYLLMHLSSEVRVCTPFLTVG